MNHTPHFPTRVTVMNDTMPVFCEEPTDPIDGKLLYQPNSGHTEWKFQVACSFLGTICLVTGRHNGTMSDKEIWERTSAEHPCLFGEWVLADGVYSGIPHMLTPAENDVTGQAIRYNRTLSHYRARIEHINHLIKHHAMLNGTVHCKDVEVLAAAFYVTVSLTNVELKRYPRYWPYGPWSHFV